MEMPQPGPEHAWLTRLVGDWTYEGNCSMGPDLPPETTSGRWRIRSLGGFWIVADGEGTTSGCGEHSSIMTIGFDQASGRFVGSFVASMMSKLWIYDGAFDGENRLVLAAKGPSFSGDGEALYHDIIEAPGDGSFRFFSRLQGEDGSWTDFMSADYRRAA